MERPLRLILLALGAGVLGCSSRSGGAIADAGDTDGYVDSSLPSVYLTDLEVTAASDAGQPITLVPPFSPNVFDYYVRCASGGSQLLVTLSAAPGALGALIAPVKSPSRTRQTVTVGVLENQAIVATVTGGGNRNEYWVRCLPADFPPMNMVAHTDVGAVTPGYYLIGTALPMGVGGYAMALDRQGVPVWYVHPRPPIKGSTQGAAAGDVDNLIPNSISFFSGDGLPVEVYDLGPPLEETTAMPEGEVMDSHELRVLKNGNFLVPSNPLRTGVDLTGLSIVINGKTVQLGSSSNILDCNLVEFDPKTGAVVWRWTGIDYFDPKRDTIEMQLADGTGPDGGPIIDAFHCNSIDVEPETGDLLVSSRDMDSIFYVERKTGHVLWKLGGKEYTKNGATYVKVDDPFYAQHDARLMAGWSPSCGGKGQITLFDDHTYHTGMARGIIMDVVVGPSGSPGCGSATPGANVTWQYQGPSSSLSRGSFRIQPDGSRVIGWGNLQTPQLVFTEVSSAGQDLLDFYFQDSDASYRAIKVPPETFDIHTLRATAGQ